MLPHLNDDIKESICRAARIHNICSSTTDVWPRPIPQQFAALNFTLSHVSSSWRRAALKHAWHTVYLDEPEIESVISQIRIMHGHHTRKLCIQVRFKSIVSHYRRYSLTHEKTDLQPFCDLHLWSKLCELEITYMHKCAFPGLAAYLEPRLGNIRKLTIRGRVPIDMRRGVLFLKSDALEEISLEALPREDDSLSTISSHHDPILALQVSKYITCLSLTTMVDIRIIRSVMASSRQHLTRLELSGLSPEQLVTAGIWRLSGDTRELLGEPWLNLKSLVIRLCTHANGESPVLINLNASEFPCLEYLALSDCSTVADPSEFPLRVSHEQTFQKQWPNLMHLQTLTLNDLDAQLISQFVPRLRNLRARSIRQLGSDGLPSALGILHLLAGLPRLSSLTVDCHRAENAENGSNHRLDKASLLPTDNIADFALIRREHPLLILDISNVTLSDAQILLIRQRCGSLVRLKTKSENNPAPPSPSMALWSVARLESRRILDTYFAAAPYQNIVRIMSMWGGA